ncbi:MAG: hypothetical protein MZW92_23400 [Comamonadaceae bacterium]|nr:hypothetical protein [Comamonadaceae bacterium]
MRGGARMSRTCVDHGAPAPAGTSMPGPRRWRARCSAAAGRVSWLGTRARHGEPARAAGAASRWTRSASPACAARACVHTLTGGLRLLKAFWDCLRHPAPARRRRRARHGRLRVLSRRA